MATNEVYRNADRLALPVASGVVSGQPVQIGTLVGVALTARGGGGNAATEATVALKGAFSLSISDAVASVGLAVYITSGGTLTTTASGNTLFGYSLATKGAGAGVIPIRIAQV